VHKGRPLFLNQSKAGAVVGDPGVRPLAPDKYTHPVTPVTWGTCSPQRPPLWQEIYLRVTDSCVILWGGRGGGRRVERRASGLPM
jgi:hypothetical protein